MSINPNYLSSSPSGTSSTLSSFTPTGMRAEERALNGTSNYTSTSLGSLVQGISSYIPSSFKKQLYSYGAGGTNATPPPTIQSDDDKETILWSSFEDLHVGDQTRGCLVLGYTTGFQIWDLTSEGGVREVASVREAVAIKCARLLSPPLERDAPSSTLYGKRPLVAVVSAEETREFPRSVVRLYSLRTCDYVFDIGRFRTPVLNVMCNRRVMLVVLRDQLYGFSLLTMERLFILNTAASPSPYGVAALGPRWLAFATTQPLAPSPISQASGMEAGPTDSGSGKLVDVARDVATDVVKEAAQGLYYLGDMASKKVMNYLYPEEAPVPSHYAASSPAQAPHPAADADTLGVVVVFDVCTRKVVAHFRAHSHAISLLSFDPTGTLLVSSSVEGRSLNVYQITPSVPAVLSAAPGVLPGVPPLEQTKPVRPLYKLVRGMTAATIHTVGFSKDSKWMAASTIRGTTHIFAINPLGGSVTLLTHPSPGTHGGVFPGNMSEAMSFKLGLPPALIQVSAVGRVKHPLTQSVDFDQAATASSNSGVVIAPSAGGNVKTQFNCIVSASSFADVHGPSGTERMYVVAQSGALTMYHLQPHAGSDPADPNALHLGVVPITEWEVARKPRWAEFRTPIITPEVNAHPASTTEAGGETLWLANVEITTHTPHLRPLWAGPQFTFKTFQTNHNTPTTSINMPSTSSSPAASFVMHDEPSLMSVIPSPSSRYTVAPSDETTPTRTLEVKARTPMPFKEGMDDTDAQGAAPEPAAMISEPVGKAVTSSDIKSSIMQAMATPMDRPKTKIYSSGSLTASSVGSHSNSTSPSSSLSSSPNTSYMPTQPIITSSSSSSSSTPTTTSSSSPPTSTSTSTSSSTTAAQPAHPPLNAAAVDGRIDKQMAGLSLWEEDAFRPPAPKPSTRKIVTDDEDDMVPISSDSVAPATTVTPATPEQTAVSYVASQPIEIKKLAPEPLAAAPNNKKQSPSSNNNNSQTKTISRSPPNFVFEQEEEKPAPSRKGKKKSKKGKSPTKSEEEEEWTGF
eukprot:TRINITY_DN2446_c0_g1_i2.p1 TRINITY_DN2446_c0_g1~~TRINITY_DN2446_c0_g1_i2.p1  ORF type:complete len:1025 (+),score=298.39 TRINITY_DN2446_c0_g1_i2:247-3321(+)